MKKLAIPGYLHVLLVLLLIIVVIFIMIIGRSLLIPLFLAAYIAMLMIPACNWLEGKKIPRPVSAILSLLAAITVIVGIIRLIIFQVRSFSSDFEDVSERLNNYLTDIDRFASDNLGTDLGIGGGIDKTQLFELIESNSETVSNFLFSTIGSLSGVILVPVFTFFLLIYRDHFAEFMAKIYSKHDSGEVHQKITSLRQIARFYIIGVFKVMAILAVLNTGVLYALGVKHALFFGLTAALLNIIPYLGPVLGAVLPFIFALLTMDGLFTPFAIVIAFTLIQLVESNLLTPRIVGKNVNLNAFVTFTGLLVGGAIWGIAGMVLIIPSLAIMKRIFELSESTKPFSFLLGEEEESLNNEKKYPIT